MVERIEGYLNSLDRSKSATSGENIFRPKHLMKPKTVPEDFDVDTCRFLLGQTHNTSFQENMESHINESTYFKVLIHNSIW